MRKSFEDWSKYEYAKIGTEQDLYLNCSVSWLWTKPAANKQLSKPVA